MSSDVNVPVLSKQQISTCTRRNNTKIHYKYHHGEILIWYHNKNRIKMNLSNTYLCIKLYKGNASKPKPKSTDIRTT